jgi:hypothetical protein
LTLIQHYNLSIWVWSWSGNSLWWNPRSSQKLNIGFRYEPAKPHIHQRRCPLSWYLSLVSNFDAAICPGCWHNVNCETVLIFSPIFLLSEPEIREFCCFFHSTWKLFSSWGSELKARIGCMEFVVYEVALGQIFSPSCLSTNAPYSSAPGSGTLWMHVRW